MRGEGDTDTGIGRRDRPVSENTWSSRGWLAGLLVAASTTVALSAAGPRGQGSVSSGIGSGPTNTEVATPGSIPVTAGEISERGFVADAACVRCHRDIATSFQTLGMARSFGKPAAVATVEDFEHSRFEHAGTGRTYEMTQRGDDLVFRRWETAGDGQPIHQIEQVVDWVLGSGSTSRTYLVQTTNGRLFQLPIAWYSQDSKWAMAPGFDSQAGEPNHEGLLRPVRRECLYCHTAYPASGEAAAGGVSSGISVGSKDSTDRSHVLDDRRFAEQVFPHALPAGIGCQRCHGPGAAHVAAAGSPTTAASAHGRRRQRDLVRSTILDPADLSPERRRDVCAQCHYQPSVAVFGQRQYDRRDLQFRAGETLADFIFELEVHEAAPPVHSTAESTAESTEVSAEAAAAVSGGFATAQPTAPDRPADPADRFEINHHAYRLEQSPCFLRSAPGRLECTSCHDPHRKPSTEEMATRTATVCSECHRKSEDRTADTRGLGSGGSESRGAETLATGNRGTESRGTESRGTESRRTESRGTENLGTGNRDVEHRGAKIRGTKQRSGVEATGQAAVAGDRLDQSAAPVPDDHPQGQCASCHMPRRRTQDVVHVVMTDHRIQRAPPAEGERLRALSERSPILLDLTPMEPPFAAHGATPAGAPSVGPSHDPHDNPHDHLHDHPLMAQMVRATAVLRTGSSAPIATLERLLGEAKERGWADELLFEPRLRLAQALLTAGDIDRSVAMLEELRGESELVDQPVQLLSVALSRQGRAAEARALLLEVIDRAKEAGEPEPDTLLFNVALLDRALGEERDCRRLERSVELNELLVQGWHHLGECYRRLDQLEDTARAWERALAIAPNHPKVPVLLAEVLEALGRTLEARRLLEHHASDRVRP